MITALSEKECYSLLRGGRLARLACVADGFPYVVPVNYVFDGESFIVHSMPGRKVEAMRADPRVCLQVDEIESHLRWKSVLACGTYAEVSDAAARARALACILSVFPHLTPVETVIADDANAPSPVVFRVRVERVTGVKEG
jgi:nitroimidazol reductase NimA-like FMN-containing flavoprotein (pyridoxamine 5'-phosphate oxidase superfamily)